MYVSIIDLYIRSSHSFLYFIIHPPVDILLLLCQNKCWSASTTANYLWNLLIGRFNWTLIGYYWKSWEWIVVLYSFQWRALNGNYCASKHTHTHIYIVYVCVCVYIGKMMVLYIHALLFFSICVLLWFKDCLDTVSEAALSDHLWYSWEYFIYTHVCVCVYKKVLYTRA